MIVLTQDDTNVVDNKLSYFVYLRCFSKSKFIVYRVKNCVSICEYFICKLGDLG